MEVREASLKKRCVIGDRKDVRNKNWKRKMVSQGERQEKLRAFEAGKEMQSGWRVKCKEDSAKRRDQSSTQGPSHIQHKKIMLKCVLLYLRNNRKTFKQRNNMIRYLFLKTSSGCSVKHGLEEEKEETVTSFQERENGLG